METVSRCAYALASFKNQTQDYNEYLQKKVLLEESCSNIRNLIKARKNQEKTIAVNALYSENLHITACAYRGFLFIGFQDRETGKISLNDYSDMFVEMPEAAPGKLEARIENAIIAEENGRQDFMSQQLVPLWEKLAPMLDKIIEHENEFKKLPVYAQESLTRQAQKEAQIEKIIADALKDIVPEEKNFTVKRGKEEKERLEDIPLSKRFSEARKEAEEKREAGIRNIIDKAKIRELVQ